MTARTRSERPGYEKYVSAIVTVGTTIDFEGLNESKPHCFVGVEFFSDIAGTPATASAGTVAVTVATANGGGASFEAFPDNVIAAPTPTTLGWDGNTQKVKLVPTGIATATHWRATVTQNCK